MPPEQRQKRFEHVNRFLLTVALICGLAVVLVVFAVPYLPMGTDLYVHVLWPWQVMRCLSTASLPFWFPDLNAGFGSPGIQLYSPLVPTVCGLLGLALGTVGRALRAVLMMAALAMLMVVPGISVRTRMTTTLLLLAAPAMVVEFFGRFPVAQLVSVPLAFVLLHHAVEARWSWRTDGALLALMWLAHAPTTIMVGILAALAPWLGSGIEKPEQQGRAPRNLRARLGVTVRVLMTSVVAAGLTAWHWWPLLATTKNLSFQSALTGGEQDPLRNLIGVAEPHLAEINMAMGWAAVGLLAAMLVSGGWRTGSGKLVVLAVFLSTSLSTIIWEYVRPLTWINFPWRWLLPATLLAVPIIVRTDGCRPTRRRWLAMAFLMFPLLAAPSPVLVPDPGLATHTEPYEAGRRVLESFSGNPLLVDVKEHRPLWWESLAPTLEVMGARFGILVPEGGAVEVLEWRPLRRVIAVTTPQPATAVIRVLADEHWWARVNDHSVVQQRWGAALAVQVPQGHSTLEITWSADWRAIVGAVIALATLGFMVLASLRRRRMAGLVGGGTL